MAKKTTSRRSSTSRSAARAARTSSVPAAAPVGRDALEAAINQMERQTAALDALIDAAAGDARLDLRREQLGLIGATTTLRDRVVAVDTQEYRALAAALDASGDAIRAAETDIARVGKVITAVARVIDATTRVLALG